MKELVKHFFAVTVIFALLTPIACADNFLWTEGSFLKDGNLYTSIQFPGSTLTDVHGINNSGQIVGVYVDSTGVEHGFLKDGNAYISIDFPGATATAAMAISNSGHIVGNYLDSTGVHNFLLDGSTFTSFSYPENTYSSYVYGINTAGQIIGGDDYSWLKEGDTYTPIIFPGASGTYGLGINDFGQIVGLWYGDNWESHGFIKDGDAFISFDFPGGFDIRPRAINNLGQVVGWYDSPEGQYAFLKDGDTYTSFSFPGSLSADEALGINDAGQIIGIALGWPRVLVDINTRDDINTINLKTKTVSVAILSTADFDAFSLVDQTSLTFGVTGDQASLLSCARKARDVNEDGLKDLVCTFSVKKTEFQCYSTVGTLKGETKDTQVLFEGRQRVTIKPCK